MTNLSHSWVRAAAIGVEGCMADHNMYTKAA